MSFELRPYQEQATAHAVKMLEERGNSLIVAGTGAGKTIMMSKVIGSFFNGFKAKYKRSPHILVLVHRNEIHNQNKDKFCKVNPHIGVSEITSGKRSLKGFVHFGMVQTVSNIMSDLEESKCFFDLIVIDEAHHAKASTYVDIIQRNLKGNPFASLLGVTATPNRGDKLPLIDLFDNFYQITVKYLIESHYLVRPTFLDLSPVFDTENGTEKGHLSVNLKNDDAGDKLIEDMIKTYLLAKDNGQTVIFAPSHEFCQRIYKMLKKLGRNPSYLSLGIDEVARLEELSKFESGESEELINVDICTEGYDYPPIRNLVEFDTNGTHGQWVQKVGRVLRTCPGKFSAKIIDFGGNIDKYPDGIETTVLLEGALIKEKGEKLNQEDLLTSEEMQEAQWSNENSEQIAFDYTANVSRFENEKYSPYNLPLGFESVNDTDFGIVFVACFKKFDYIIVPKGNDEYILFKSNKETLNKISMGNFEFVIAQTKTARKSENFERDNKPISKMQIKLLAPDFPTSALDWYGANCCICFKAFKTDILNMGLSMV